MAYLSSEMKIAYDSQIFCSQTYGGISRYFCETASRIAKEPDVQVVIAAPMHINAYLENVSPKIVSGFRAPPAAAHFHPLRRRLGLVFGDLMLRAMAPDLVHETFFHGYPLGSRRTRRVLTIYDMIHEKFASSFPHTDKTARYKALAAERADHVICISESTRQDALEILGLSPGKTSVIYLGFDLMKGVNNKVEGLVEPIGEPYLLYVGKRGGYKNFLRLLEAYGTSSQLKSHYTLICFGGGAFKADELRALQSLGLDGARVKHLEGDDQLLAEFYERASAFIFPSLYEGFGIPPLEAMSHDCPVVCSNTSSIPEVVGDAGEYFDPHDVEAMRVAIERVVMSDSHRKLLIAKGRVRLKRFSWDRCAAETLDVYKKLS
ncbi:MAG: glycosyltransferase family 4 protein [Nitrospira sp.]|nr:glycosyltransferase family 4 protein [Nitrospira sp.]MDH5193006.1 glycosyltransferase family 4 protein [Nitrospira sp.]